MFCLCSYPAEDPSSKHPDSQHRIFQTIHVYTIHTSVAITAHPQSTVGGLSVHVDALSHSPRRRYMQTELTVLADTAAVYGWPAL